MCAPGSAGKLTNCRKKLALCEAGWASATRGYLQSCRQQNRYLSRSRFFFLNMRIPQGGQFPVAIYDRGTLAALEMKHGHSKVQFAMGLIASFATLAEVPG